MDTKLSWAEAVHQDELDEEFDTFPTSKQQDIVRMRATSLFVILCLIVAVALYVTPFKIVVLVVGLFFLRHPRFRSKLPSVPNNFFRRLPARADSML
ncbi:hypothetical protein RHSIM_Rhsim04G0098300 [Rhododendron simsii]|uniref:Multiple C2 domain-containing protein n=1 Tax=Rhododendron simsii TaxID=118357 RepID=A0A834LQS2_RHOSS|nr:hypothetical protein RHSIM_Rhsim04G0098300 [Rhododendron simsii]